MTAIHNLHPQTKPRADALASTRQASGPTLLHARLTIRDGQRFGTLGATGQLWLTPAAGCLLQPEVGDLVLASTANGQTGYVLTVLERANPKDARTLSAPGDLRVELPNGELRITAVRGIRLDTDEDLTVRAKRWHAAFHETAFSSQTMTVTGDTIASVWHTRSDICGGTHLKAATHSEAYYGNSLRRVAGHEESSARSLRLCVDYDWTLRAQSATLRAQDLATINADSIQIG